MLGTALRIPIAALGLPASLVVMSLVGWTLAPGLGFGLEAIYAAILIDMYSRVGVNLFRFATGRWKMVARRSAIGAGDD